MPSRISRSRADSLFAGMRMVVPSGSLLRSMSELSFLMSLTLKPGDVNVCLVRSRANRRTSLGGDAVYSVALANGVGSHANACLYKQASSPCWGLCVQGCVCHDQQHRSLWTRKHLDCDRFANVLPSSELYGRWLHVCDCVASNSNPDRRSLAVCAATRCVEYDDQSRCSQVGRVLVLSMCTD